MFFDLYSFSEHRTKNKTELKMVSPIIFISSRNCSHAFFSVLSCCTGPEPGAEIANVPPKKLAETARDLVQVAAGRADRGNSSSSSGRCDAVLLQLLLRSRGRNARGSVATAATKSGSSKAVNAIASDRHDGVAKRRGVEARLQVRRTNACRGGKRAETGRQVPGRSDATALNYQRREIRGRLR